MKDFIPVSQPFIGQKELERVSKVVESGWVSSIGSEIELFEEQFAEYIGTENCLSTSNGTTALHLALLSAGVKPEDEVIMTNWTFVSPANAILYCGASPVLIDVNTDYGMPDVDSIVSAVTDKTKAIIIVHPYGKVFPVLELKAKLPKSIVVIEDCAEAHGATFKDKRVGSLGDIGVFSFYGNKIITTGEGGCLVTDNIEFHLKAALLRDHAMDPNNRYFHNFVGYNYRMTTMQAALGVAQLSQIEEFLSERKEIECLYRKKLAGNDHIKFLKDHSQTQSVNWLTTLFISNYSRAKIDAVGVKLNEYSIQTRPVFYPVSSMPEFRNTSLPEGSLGADTLSASGISLPTFNGISQSDIERVCEKLLAIVERN